MSRFDRLFSASVIFLIFLGTAPAATADSGSPPEASPSSASDTEAEARLRALEARVRELAEAVETLKKQAGATDSATIAELERQIDILTREIERLKIGEAAAPTAGKSAHGLGPAASKVYQLKEGVSVGGYGELVYRDFASRDDSGAVSGTSDRLDLLRAVLYFGTKWNDRILFNSEIEFEHATTGEGDEEKGEASVEFAYLDFLFRKGLNVRAGLLLVPVGLLNEMHEPTTFHGVLRPGVERWVLPTTWRENGAGVFGETRWIAYRAYLMAGLDALGFSAGEGIRGGRQGGSQSLAEDLAMTGRVDFTGVPGLLAGASAFTGNSAQGQFAAEARVALYDVHAQYHWWGAEIRGLWTRVSIGDTENIDQALGILPGRAESVGERLAGYYLQAAWDLFSLRQGSHQSLSPVVRFEAFDTQDRVPPGFQRNPASNQRLWTLGLTWKPIPQVAIKADYQDADDGAGTGIDEFHVGLGWIF